MKNKKYIVGAIVAIIIGICIVVVLMINYRSSADRNNKVTVDKKPGKVASEQTDKDIDQTGDVKIDTEPSSITVLVNKEYKLPEDYKPSDLVVPKVKFSFDYEDEKKYLRVEAADALEKMFVAASSDGHELLGVSGFRSYTRQKSIYEANLLKYGYDYTWLYSAMPGTSEHQTGLAIDISCKSMNGLLRSTFGETKEGRWVEQNAYKYGYIVRYPSRKSDVTGYGYEPWHIRYVGVELATILYNRGITLDEYYGYTMSLGDIERETYAYYDELLTQKESGNTDLSQAVLDDLLDEQDVEDKDDFIPEEPELPQQPEDDIGDLDDPNMTEEPIVEPTMPIVNTQRPTVVPSKAPVPTQAPTALPTQVPTETPTQNPGGQQGGGSNNNNNGNNRPNWPWPGNRN